MKKTLLILLLFVVCATPVCARPIEYLAVYRYFNIVTGEYLFTADRYEDYVLIHTPTWRTEGIGWCYSARSGDVVYRLFNEGVNDHVYTTDTNEVETLKNNGWILENDGYPAFRSYGSVPIYRLYSPASRKHLYTADVNEYNALPGQGWSQEGVTLYATLFTDGY